MSECQRVAELLPWLVNGTLEPAEAEGARAHVAGCAACASELAETRAVWALGAGHLPAGALADYVFGAPPAGLRRVVEAHVRDCGACAAELALARESRTALTDEAAAPSWSGRAARAAAAASAPPATPSLASRGTAWRYAAWAATLVAAVALGGWVRTAQRADRERLAWQARERVLAAQEAASRSMPAPSLASPVPAAFDAEHARAEIARLRARLERAASPQVNPVVIELLPRLAEALRVAPRHDDDVNLLGLPAGATHVTLVLVANGAGAGRPHHVELRDEHGAVVWRAQGLRSRAGGDFTLRLPVTLVPAGRFELRVSSEENVPVAVYDVLNRAASR